jgi:hypothetical protein
VDHSRYSNYRTFSVSCQWALADWQTTPCECVSPAQATLQDRRRDHIPSWLFSGARVLPSGETRLATQYNMNKGEFARTKPLLSYYGRLGLPIEAKAGCLTETSAFSARAKRTLQAAFSCGQRTHPLVVRRHSGLVWSQCWSLSFAQLNRATAGIQVHRVPRPLPVVAAIPGHCAPDRSPSGRRRPGSAPIRLLPSPDARQQMAGTMYRQASTPRMLRCRRFPRWASISRADPP